MSNAKPCLFLDRDGVIIQNVPYATSPGTVVLREGIGALIQRARAKGFLVICVTNQSGIGRGWVSLEAYEAITARMNELLKLEACTLDAIYFAPYYDKAQDPKWLEKPDWRKPAPGMILQACADHAIDLQKSLFVGDRGSDLEAAKNGRVARPILVEVPDYPNEAQKAPAGIQFEFYRTLYEIPI
jgi:D-glycero-D-manno-heptose 1,7-bisphosphate phosphatase